MTATVWAVSVEVGQQVIRGDTLVILESMKMEIEVESPVPGRVEAILVEQGCSVREGDVLVLIADLLTDRLGKVALAT